MDWREFIASVIDSLAWPGAIAFAAWLLRGQLRQLLAAPLGTVKVTATGAELAWDRGIGMIAASTAKASAESRPSREPPPAGHDVDAELDNLARLIEHSPSAALQQAFAIVERELRRLIDERGVELPPGVRGPDALVKAAFRAGAISKATCDALRGLIQLYNLAASDPSGTRVTPEKASEYLVLVRAVLYALEAGALNTST